jgi:hypothetical protein
MNKEAIIQMLQTHMPDYKNIKWKKDSHKQHALNIEELALVYYAIQVSNDCDRNNSDRMIRNSFSYKRIQEVFRTVLGKGCHRAKCSKILQILHSVGLIEKTGNYICSVRGNCYRIRPA